MRKVRRLQIDVEAERARVAALTGTIVDLREAIAGISRLAHARAAALVDRGDTRGANDLLDVSEALEALGRRG